MKLVPVRIIGTGSFLPGPAVPNDRLEQILGPLSEAPLKVRSFVENLGPKMLERAGVTTRHLAIDPATGDMTQTFSSMAEIAGRRALEMAGKDPGEVELLIMSCPSYDQSTPPTSALLQERLGIETCAEMEIHSNCAGVGKGVQIASHALACGQYRTALVCYSQLSSVYLRSCYFNQAKMTKPHAALRWILADGAGAVVLRAGENGTPGHALLGTHVESVGANRPAGMTAGGAAADLVKAERQIPQMYDSGAHHLWQDFTAVHENAAPLLLEGICRAIEKHQIAPESVDHYVVSIPTRQLYDQHIPAFLDRLKITPDKIKFRSGEIGYCGGAATLIHLDDMVRSGELRDGQLVVVHAVESSKWMTAGFIVRW
ncbi:MAG: 3-oxoacyl-ACP synthase III family protein [Planctomycetota bacterium]|nr:3-oxoacyl-ACP synthase III family protein [Planctomycetota bacterium]